MTKTEAAYELENCDGLECCTGIDNPKESEPWIAHQMGAQALRTLDQLERWAEHQRATSLDNGEHVLLDILLDKIRGH